MEKLGQTIDKFDSQLVDLRRELWLTYSLFSWQWWMLVGICALTLIAFILLVKRERLIQAIAFYGVIMLLNHYLDAVATAFNWYDYPIQLLPYLQTMIPMTLFVVPMVLTLLYQYLAKWGPYFMGIMLFSALLAYIALPLMRAVHIYTPKLWNSHWSFISLFLMAAIAKSFIDWAGKPRQAHASSEERLVRPLSSKKEKAR